jgi:hypothetical protein
MSLERRVSSLAIGLLAAFLAGFPFAPCRAQEPRSLAGQELQPRNDLDPKSILGQLLLSGGGGGGGKVEKVVVREDGERRLAITVTVSKLDGRQVVGELLSSKRQRQRQFRSAPVTLEAGATQAELTFEPDETVPENTPVDSPYLRLSVMRPGVPVAELERVYKLDKRWLLAIPPERQVLKIVLRPLGAAAQLRDQPVIVRPRIQVSRIPAPAVPADAAPAPGNVRKAEAAGAMARVAVSPQTELAIQRPLRLETQAAVAALPVSAQMVTIDRFHFGVKQEDQAKGAKGPSAARLDLLEGLMSEPPVERESILSVAREVFQDSNPASGVYYFLPQSYRLRWNPDEGYGLRMLYSAASGEGQAGNVLMAARLDAGVDTGAVNLAEALLKALSARNPSIRFTALRPLPIDAPPAVSLSGGLEHQYDIPADKIAIHSISDALAQIDASWVTDGVTKQNLQLALAEDVGINGNLTLTPAGGGLPARSLPVSIQIADADTFGEIRFRRGETWRNPTAYPVRLKSMRALLIENNEPIVYSWDLGNTDVPPKAQAELDASAVPAWVDGRAKRMWIDYGVARDCRSCDEQVMAALTAGVTSLGSSQISFHTITPLADTGAYEIRVAVRSKYFDPRLRDLQVKPDLVLGEDNKDFTTGPIYLVNRQPGQSVPGDPLFEYLLAVTMPSGETHAASRWIPSDNLRVLVGKVQVQQALGFLPGAQP